jgi:hypothetical protein
MKAKLLGYQGNLSEKEREKLLDQAKLQKGMLKLMIIRAKNLRPDVK